MAHRENYCDICGSQCREANSPRDSYIIDCLRCGQFEITRHAVINFERQRDDSYSVAIVSGWIREQVMQGTRPFIDAAQMGRVLLLPLPSFVRRTEFYLRLAVKRQVVLNGEFESLNPTFISATYSADVNELGVIRRYLIGQGLLEARAQDRCRVSPLGFIEADKLALQHASTSDAFVAMWFHPDMREIYDTGFAAAITEAGYRPVRVDAVEHVGKIDDEIIAQIRRARFLVADFTGHRGGVYFEAGFAMGLNKPIIWTCKRKDIEALHFDIRQYNCIDWVSADDLRPRLTNRISATIGDGPNRKN